MGKTFQKYSNLQTETMPGVSDVAQKYYEKSVLNMPLGEEAFHDCTSLTSVVIPEGVTEIGVCAFAECTSLTSIVIPKSVTEIGKDAFAEHVEIIRE